MHNLVNGRTAYPDVRERLTPAPAPGEGPETGVALCRSGHTEKIILPAPWRAEKGEGGGEVPGEADDSAKTRRQRREPGWD